MLHFVRPPEYCLLELHATQSCSSPVETVSDCTPGYADADPQWRIREGTHGLTADPIFLQVSAYFAAITGTTATFLVLGLQYIIGTVRNVGNSSMCKGGRGIAANLRKYAAVDR